MTISKVECYKVSAKRLDPLDPVSRSRICILKLNWHPVTYRAIKIRETSQGEEKSKINRKRKKASSHPTFQISPSLKPRRNGWLLKAKACSGWIKSFTWNQADTNSSEASQSTAWLFLLRAVIWPKFELNRDTRLWQFKTQIRDLWL